MKKVNMAKEGLIIIRKELDDIRDEAVKDYEKDNMKGYSGMYYHGKVVGLEKAIEKIDLVLKVLK